MIYHLATFTILFLIAAIAIALAADTWFSTPDRKGEKK